MPKYVALDLYCCETGTGLVDLNSDCCAYWPFNESHGNAIDLTSSNFDLVEHGDGGIGGDSINFIIDSSRVLETGGTVALSDQYFSHPSGSDKNCFSIQQGYTIWGWAKIKVWSTASGGEAIATKFSSPPSKEWQIFASSGTFPGPGTDNGITLDGGGVFTTIDSTEDSSLTHGSWVFIAAWYDNIAQKWGLRVNETVKTNTDLTIPTVTSGAFWMGATISGGGSLANPFHGNLDEWGIITRQLNEPELDYLYNEGTGRRPTCVSDPNTVGCPYYALDECSSSAIDATTGNLDLLEAGTVKLSDGIINTGRHFNVTGTDIANWTARNYFTGGHNDCYSIQQGYTTYGWFQINSTLTSTLQHMLAFKGSGIPVAPPTPPPTQYEWYLSALVGASAITGVPDGTSSLFFDVAAHPHTDGVTYNVNITESDFLLEKDKWYLTAASVDTSNKNLILRVADVDGIIHKKTTSYFGYHLAEPSSTYPLYLGGLLQNGSLQDFPLDGRLDEWGFSTTVFSDNDFLSLYNKNITSGYGPNQGIRSVNICPCAYYNCDNTILDVLGTGVFIDSSPNYYDVRRVSTATTSSTSGIIESGIETDGFYQRDNAERCFAINEGGTVWGWTYIRAKASSWPSITIWQLGVTIGVDIQWILQAQRLSSTTWRFASTISNSAYIPLGLGNFAFSDNKSFDKWYFYAFRFNTEAVSGYLFSGDTDNNVHEGDHIFDSYPTYVSAPLRHVTVGLDGMIHDEIGFVNYNLSDEEIRWLYHQGLANRPMNENCLPGNTLCPLAYYKCEEPGSGDALIDSIGGFDIEIQEGPGSFSSSGIIESGRFGRADWASYHGDDDCLSIQEHGGTAWAWIKWEGSGADSSNKILGKWALSSQIDSAANCEWQLQSGNQIRNFTFSVMEIDGTSTNVSISDGGTKPADGVWYLMMGWVDRQNKKVHLRIRGHDGFDEEDSTSYTTELNPPITGSALIVSEGGGSDNIWIDEMGIIGKNLTDVEKDWLWNSGSGRRPVEVFH